MASPSLTKLAPAKINLYFEILGKRPDGYHEVVTVMQKVDLFDRLHFSSSENGFQFTCSDPTLPIDDTNLVIKAAKMFFDFSGFSADVAIHLDKHIPVAAGLGGGSSDAGTCIKGLNEFLNAGISQESLIELSMPIGADVPFFVSDWPATCATGIGNKIHFVSPIDPCWVLLVNPGVHVSTKWVYDNFTLTRKSNQYKLGGCLKSSYEADCTDEVLIHKANASELLNDLEAVTINKHRVIQEIKDELVAHGAVSSLMSGSGSTVFGVFEQLEFARKSYSIFAERYPAVYLTEPIQETVAA